MDLLIEIRDLMKQPEIPTVTEQELNDTWGVSDRSAREIVLKYKGRMIVE